MMRTAWILVTGFAFVGWLSCGDSSSSSDLFANAGAGGGLSTSATGTTSSTGSAGTDGSTTGAVGSGVGTTATATGAGGSGSGGSGGPTGGTGTAGAGTAGAGTGGEAGSAGQSGTAGSGGANAGTGGVSGAGGSGGAAGSAGTAGAKSDGGLGGAAGGPVDAGPPDTGSQAVIRCGSTSCPVATHFCCIPTNEIARCVALTATNLCPDTADRIRCDDRSDCPSANQVCCAEAGFAVMGASVMCRTQAACDSLNQTQELCEPGEAGQCQGGGTNACRIDNQSFIAGYAFCH